MPNPINEKKVNSPEKKLGQILVDNGKLNSAEIKHSLEIQEKSASHKLLGGILIEQNLISKDDLIFALNKQLQYLENGKDTGPNLSDDDEIKRIAEKYRETEYYNDLYGLISVITHKIRNPLAGISAAAEVLEDKTGKNNTNEKLFQMIFKEIDRLETIVKNLYKTFSNK